MSFRPLFLNKSQVSLGYLEPKVLPNREEFPSDCVSKAHRHSHKLPFPAKIDFREFFELKRVFLLLRSSARANPGGKKAFLCFAYAGDSRHLKSSIIRLICLIDILHTWRRYQTSTEEHNLVRRLNWISVFAEVQSGLTRVLMSLSPLSKGWYLMVGPFVILKARPLLRALLLFLCVTFLE